MLPIHESPLYFLCYSVRLIGGNAPTSDLVLIVVAGGGGADGVRGAGGAARIGEGSRVRAREGEGPLGRAEGAFCRYLKTFFGVSDGE